MESSRSIWTQRPSAMHCGCGGQACVAVTSSTQVLHWMHHLIEYLQYTLQWKLSSPFHKWREWSSESWNRYCVWTERSSLELILHNWSKEANAHFPKRDPLGILPSRCFSSPASTCWEDTPFWRIFTSLFFLEQTGWIEKVKYLKSLVCAVRHLAGQG